MSTLPLVRVIVVDHNGGDLTMRCLRDLSRTDWPRARLQFVLVDNGSSRTVVDEATRALPGIRCIRLDVNRGFAGGVNAGLDDLEGVEYVALVNNDAFVEPGWLRPLVQTLSESPRRGAATAKVLFASPFVSVSLCQDAAEDGGAGPVDITGLRLDGAAVLQQARSLGAIRRVDASNGASARLRVRSRAEVLVPVADASRCTGDAEVRLSARRRVGVQIDAGVVSRVSVDRTARWTRIRVDQLPTWRINNAGTLRRRDGSGFDRGYLEPDDGRYDLPCEVVAWSGTVALLKRAYLDDVGTFDERLFAYYEDLDLALRGDRRGWTYYYVPRSVARHIHTATSKEGSDRFVYYNLRNRLITVARHDPYGLVLTVAAKHFLGTVDRFCRDVLLRALTGRRPVLRVVTLRARAFGSFLVLLPGTLRLRRADQRRPMPSWDR